MVNFVKKTKIVCTIGPKSESKKILSMLLKAGMNAMRLNFSHGIHQEHKKRIQNLRSILKNTDRFVSILLDMQGPEVRTTKLEHGEDVTLYSGQNFSFILDQNIVGNNQRVGVTCTKIVDLIKVGDEILVDDGMLKMSVIQFSSHSIVCKVLNTGNLGENKSINLPGKLLKLPILSEKDKKDLTFGILQKVDFVAISFVRNSADVLEIRKFLNEYGGKDIQIISKIENQEGLNNFDEILHVSDGIMIARGDLGVEIPIEEVVFAQKMMIKKCNQEKKIVITATQMLNSMIESPRPTRAEVSDVANAILDGTDAIMLSGESAKGKYPIESVSVMNSICERTDPIVPNLLSSSKTEKSKLSVTEAICKSSVEISERVNASLIIVVTKWGKSARLVRKYFPKVHILALTTNFITLRSLSLTRGIICKKVENVDSLEDFYCIGKKIALECQLAKKGDIVVIVSGALYGTTNSTFVCYL